MWRGSNTFIFKWKIYRWEILLVLSFWSTEKSSLFSSLSHSFFTTFSLICFFLSWLKCVGYAWKIILAATFPSVQSTMLCVKSYAYSPNVISLESALWKKSGEYDWKLSALSATPAFWSLPHGALLNEAKSCIHTTSRSRHREMASLSLVHVHCTGRSMNRTPANTHSKHYQNTHAGLQILTLSSI